MSENRKDLVDDQKRRARRRLVGAAILALAAAVIVPLFLESEPKPLGQDVQILIPAVEGSKFVNQLTAAEAGARAPVPAALPEPAAKAEAPLPAPPPKAQKSVEPPAGASASELPSASVPSEAKAAPAGAPASKAPPSPTPAQAAPPSAPARPANVAAKAPGKPEHSNAPTVPTKSADSGFVVQLGAYADAKVAAELQAKLKAAGFVAYTERIDTSKEKLHRVRVGPYPSREAAETARTQLKAKGHSGIVAPLS